MEKFIRIQERAAKGDGPVLRDEFRGGFALGKAGFALQHEVKGGSDAVRGGQPRRQGLGQIEGEAVVE